LFHISQLFRLREEINRSTLKQLRIDPDINPHDQFDVINHAHFIKPIPFQSATKMDSNADSVDRVDRSYLVPHSNMVIDDDDDDADDVSLNNSRPPKCDYCGCDHHSREDCPYDQQEFSSDESNSDIDLT
jgi:hypothetical protein